MWHGDARPRLAGDGVRARVRLVRDRLGSVTMTHTTSCPVVLVWLTMGTWVRVRVRVGVRVRVRDRVLTLTRTLTRTLTLGGDGLRRREQHRRSSK